VPVNQFAQGGIVHAAVFVHGGDECNDAARDLADGCGHVRTCKQKRCILTRAGKDGAWNSAPLTQGPEQQQCAEQGVVGGQGIPLQTQ